MFFRFFSCILLSLIVHSCLRRTKLIILGVLYVTPLLLRREVYFWDRLFRWTGSLTRGSVYVWVELAAPAHSSYKCHKEESFTLSVPTKWKFLAFLHCFSQFVQGKKKPSGFCWVIARLLRALCRGKKGSQWRESGGRGVWLMQWSRVQTSS